MSCVFPGVPEILANAFLSVNMLISDDLPTFDLPIKQYSGKCELGTSIYVLKEPLKLFLEKNKFKNRDALDIFR